jgi:pantoate--beta-alanine ligase
MVELHDVAALRSWTSTMRSAGRRIGLVPTMGALHEGHLSLVDLARARDTAVVMSIFVNPLQFGPAEDFGRYPRDLERDRVLARERGVEALFIPTVETMYPPGSETRVAPGETATRWEGAVRPGHFTGVLTVVAKLFHLVGPDLAVFGQKDIQQAVLIRRMVRDLDWPLEIVLAPTVREADGLALSSRNAYLDAGGRQRGLTLSAGLRAAEAAWQRGERSAVRLREVVRAPMAAFPEIRVDYIAVVEPDRLAPVEVAEPGTIIATAAHVGSTRLIDNMILGRSGI